MPMRVCSAAARAKTVFRVATAAFGVTAWALSRALADRGRVRTGDAVIFFNFRTDRARQLTEAFVAPGFQGFPRASLPVVPGRPCSRAKARARRLAPGHRQRAL